MTIKVIKNADLNDLDLSVRSWNCLRRAMINNVQDIVDNIDNLTKVRNLGQRCHNEVLEKIKPYVEFVDRIQITNYDRIKSMSVEEMTALITKLAFFPCELCEREHNASCTHEDCFNIHKRWLESEVSEQ